MADSLVTVRAVRADDAEGLATAHVHAWQVGYRGMMPQDYLDAIDLAKRVEQWRDWVGRGRFRRTTVAVADVGGAVAGFAIHGHEGSASESSGDEEAPGPGTVGELYSLNVHPDHWGAGVGSALMAHVLAALEEAGHTEAVLWVLPANERARRFYERRGWALDGAERTDTVQGLTVAEVRYRRPLP